MIRRLLSYLFPKTLEISSSKYNPRLEVTLENGKLMLNAERVNYAFGKLDEVWRSAFSQIGLKKMKPRNLLILGLGPGNVVQIVNRILPDCKITGVEIDGEVIRLGKKYFGLGTYANLEIAEADAVEFVAGCTERFDLICIDLFVEDAVPHGAEQEEFIRNCRRLLSPGGLLLFNRLMHTPALAKESERFTAGLQDAFPGLRTIRAGVNRVIIIQATD